LYHSTEGHQKDVTKKYGKITERNLAVVIISETLTTCCTVQKQNVAIIQKRSWFLRNSCHFFLQKVIIMGNFPIIRKISKNSKVTKLQELPKCALLLLTFISHTIIYDISLSPMVYHLPKVLLMTYHIPKDII